MAPRTQPYWYEVPQKSLDERVREAEEAKKAYDFPDLAAKPEKKESPLFPQSTSSHPASGKTSELKRDPHPHKYDPEDHKVTADDILDNMLDSYYQRF